MAALCLLHLHSRMERSLPLLLGMAGMAASPPTPALLTQPSPSALQMDQNHFSSQELWGKVMGTGSWSSPPYELPAQLQVQNPGAGVLPRDSGGQWQRQEEEQPSLGTVGSGLCTPNLTHTPGLQPPLDFWSSPDGSFTPAGISPGAQLSLFL